MPRIIACTRSVIKYNLNMQSTPVVLITGASSGIGAATAIVFAQAGYSVIIAARREDKLNEVQDRILLSAPKCQVRAIVCDVTSAESVKNLFEKVSHDFGKLNVLINNAGYGVYGSVETTSLADFQRNMETNYLGAIRCTQLALPLLRAAAKEREGRFGASIIMVSSIVGRRSMPNLSSYCATKFAMEALSEALRVELSDQRISVSVINPGVTKSEFGAAATGTRPKAFLSPGNAMSAKDVAKSMLRAVNHPVRNRYLTFAGKACIALQWLCPSLLDRILLGTWRKTRKMN